MGIGYQELKTHQRLQVDSEISKSMKPFCPEAGGTKAEGLLSEQKKV